jgi:sugar phosphate permease
MKIGKRRWLVFVLLFLLVTINYMDRSALSVAVVPIKQEFGLNATEVGLMLSAFLWSYIVCLIPAGVLTDRFGTRIINTISIALWSIATMLMGVVRGFGVLLGVRQLGVSAVAWPPSTTPAPTQGRRSARSSPPPS